MTRSAHEQEIRDAVVIRLRELFPSARIVHELNVAGQGSNRIDVAAIDINGIAGVEIKSKADTLKRLADQMKAFRKCCHRVIVAAHEKHLVVPEGYRTKRTLAAPEWSANPWSQLATVWSWPQVPHEPWELDKKALDPKARQPHAYRLLEMLWADELRYEANHHGIAAGPSQARDVMIRAMAWEMTGQEIAQAVCRQLRAREFAEADAILSPPVMTMMQDDIF